MTSTRPKLLIALYLGRHETPHSGLWVYSKNLVASLATRSAARAASGDISYAFSLYGGDSELFRDLHDTLRVTEYAGTSIQFKPHDNGARRWGILKDVFSCGPRADVLHGTANSIPVLGRARRVLSLHDVMQAFPETRPSDIYTLLRTWWYRALLYLMTHRAHAVVTVHPKIKQKILSYYPHVRNVHVVYSGLDLAFVNSIGSFPPLSPSEKEPGYLLAFASRDPRKNIEGSLTAFKAALKALPRLKLRVIVSVESLHTKINALANTLGIGDLVQTLSNISTSDLVKLYAEARGVLFPSLNEGFGYPIYEALSQGVPVVCDGDLVVSELAEACSPLFFSCVPSENDSITEALRLLLTSSFDSEVRRKVALLTREVVGPGAAADKLLNIYEGLLAGLEEKL